MENCVHCGELLSGRQTKFCSRSCKNSVSNANHQSYLAQQRRGRKRKLALIKNKGARCKMCGYRRNSAALEFHHLNPKDKSFALDLRSLSNRSWDVIEKEAKKCALLCSNCHTEVHNPDSFLQC